MDQLWTSVSSGTNKMTAANFVTKSSEQNTNEFNKPGFEKSKAEFAVPRLIGTDYTYKHQVVWKNAIGFLIMHILAVWGLVLFLTGALSWKSFVWGNLRS